MKEARESRTRLRRRGGHYFRGGLFNVAATQVKAWALWNDVLGFSGQDPSQVADIGSAKRPIAPFRNQSNLVADLQAFHRTGADCRPIFEIRRGIDDQSSILIF